MVGGTVKDVLDCGHRVWLNCRDTHCYKRSGCLGEACPHDECAIYVERDENALKIKKGDALWWQGRFAMWTPKPHKQGEPYDIEIRRVGYSGVRHPAQALVESAYQPQEGV